MNYFLPIFKKNMRGKMKFLNKIRPYLNIITGVACALLALFVLLSLGVQLFYYATYATGRQNFLNAFGSMLASVYGISSVLIPVFLIAAAICCYFKIGGTKIAFVFVAMVVPFFTIAITENICRTLLASSDKSFLAFKLTSTIIISVLLVATEIIGIMILSDKAAQVISKFIANDNSNDKQATHFADASRSHVDDTIEDDGAKDNFGIPKSIFNFANYKVGEEVEAAPKKTEPYMMSEKLKDLLQKTNEVSERISKQKTIQHFPDISLANFIAPKVNETVSKNADVVWQEAIQSDAYKPGIKEETVKIENVPTEVEDITVEKITEIEDVVANNDIYVSEFVEDIEPIEDVVLEDIIAVEDVPTQVEDTAVEEETEIEEDSLTGAKDVFAQMDEDIRNEIYAGTIKIPETYEESEVVPKQEFIEDDFNELETNEYDVMHEESAEDIYSSEKIDGRINLDDFIDEEIEEDEIGLTENELSELEDATLTEDAAFAEPSSLADISPLAEDVSLSDDSPIVEDAPFTNALPLADAQMADAPLAEEVEETITIAKLPELPPKPPKPKFKGKYKIDTGLLTEYEDDKYWIIDKETEQASLKLKETLNEFHIEADVIGIKKGPVVTMFELLPAPGVKLSKVVALQDNIALRLAASSVRIVAPIPGKQAVGIEIPNKNRSIVGFREIVEMGLPEFNKMAVPVILGKDILGKPQIIDLVKTPHLLIAGATGAGKSVCVNSMILSILYKRSPNDVKLILIDPKIVELKLYNDIPHLLTPVITEPKRAFQSLQYCLCEMERRYALLDALGVRDISNYNKRIVERKLATEKLPYIIVVIDEFADLMATTGKELETTLARLAAMSRAVGIHLVLATQRPSIDVITGLIKANIPSRIAFMVASKMDSRIIIDQVGAEKLLGRGDMLYASAVDPFPTRIQGTFVTDGEVESVVEAVKQYGEPDYIDDEIFVDDDDDAIGDPSLFGDGEDPLYNQALDIVIQSGKASASYLQRRLKIGYNRAARLVEEMEERGIVGPANGSKPREVIHVP